jgi:hypothetical protein
MSFLPALPQCISHIARTFLVWNVFWSFRYYITLMLQEKLA